MEYYIATTQYIGQAVDELHLSSDGSLWFLSHRGAVTSIDVASLQSRVHFSDTSFCSFQCNGELGVIGTKEGSVLAFSTVRPKLRLLASVGKLCPIGAIDIAEDQGLAFVVAGRCVYTVTVRGDVLGKWRCTIPPFRIRYSSSTGQLWSICDGIEVFNIESGGSATFQRGRAVPYVDVACAPDGRIACVGGSIDMVCRDGRITNSISGSYNGITFDRTARMMAREVSRRFPEDVSITTRQWNNGEFDVISTCDSYAVSGNGSIVYASHRGWIFVLVRR